MAGKPGPVESMERTDFGRVTRIRPTSRRTVDEEGIQATGEALHDLIDREGRTRIVLNLGIVGFPSGALLGKVLWLMIKLRQAEDRLARCPLSESIERTF